jgi:hypothetical protein
MLRSYVGIVFADIAYKRDMNIVMYYFAIAAFMFDVMAQSCVSDACSSNIR